MTKYELNTSPSASYVWPLCEPVFHCLQSTLKDISMSLPGSCCSCIHVDNTSTIAKIACIFLTVSATLYIIAFSSTDWVTGNERREALTNMTDLSIGVWKTCYTPQEGDKTCVKTKQFLLPDWNEEWLPGVQGMFTCGLVLLIFTTIDMWAYVMVPRLQIGISALYLAGCSSFAAAALCFLGVLIFGIQQNSDHANFENTVLNWSYGTMVMSLGCILLSYLLIMCDFYGVLSHQARKKSNRKKARERVLNALDEAVIESQNCPSSSPDGAVSQSHSQNSGDTNSVGSQSALCRAIVLPNGTDSANNDEQEVRPSQFKGRTRLPPIKGSNYGSQGMNITQHYVRDGNEIARGSQPSVQTYDSGGYTSGLPSTVNYNTSSPNDPSQLFQAK